MKLKKGIDNIDRSFHKSLKSASFRVKKPKLDMSLEVEDVHVH